MSGVVGRLAPTPSGHLHLGNATAFGAAWLSARSAGGRLLLRFEDVDRGRARADVEAAQRADLAWLGLTWDEEVAPQRDRDYAPWLAALDDRIYACTCTRQQLASCRCRGADHPRADAALRFALTPGERLFRDRARGWIRADPTQFGDPVLRRRDGLYTYNLAVVADDLADGVTEVVRGADLVEYTLVQAQLWEALGATPPTWLHAPLVLGSDGKKLSKSHGSTELRALAAAGVTAAAVRRRVLGWLGLEADRWEDALDAWDPAKIPAGPFTA